MVGHDGAFGILIGAVVGACSLVLACGSAQDSPSASCRAIDIFTPLEDLTRCAEHGLAEAHLILGLRYDSGVGVPEDHVEAFRWYRQAAALGHAEAQYTLGSMYADGEGVPQDAAEAVRWFRLAAEQGHVSSQYNLGLMYASGEGVPEDDVFAHMWFNLSAAQGNGSARGNKNIIEQRMTREQIAEAQRLSREWIETHPQDGGN